MHPFTKKRFLLIGLCSLALASAHDAHAIGASVSGGYEYVPYAELKNPPASLEQAEINQTKIYGEAVFPFIVLKEGKRVFVNALYADRFSLRPYADRVSPWCPYIACTRPVGDCRSRLCSAL